MLQVAISKKQMANDEFKDEELKLLIQSWISGEKKTDDVLRKFHEANQTWFNRQTLCFLMSEEIFLSIENRTKGFILKFYDFMTNSSISHKNVQESLVKLIESMINQLTYLNCDFQRQQNLCNLIRCFLQISDEKGENSVNFLKKDTINIMIDYLRELLGKCILKETSTNAMSTLIKFPTNKIQQMFEQASATLVPSEHNGTNICKFINMLINRSSIEQFLENVLEYLSKVLEICEQKKTLLAAILTLENLIMQKKLEFNDFLPKIFISVEKFKKNQISYEYGMDRLEHQLDLCINWGDSNIFGVASIDIINDLPIVKMSPDRLSVRNDGLKYNFPTVLSSFPTKENIYFYEAILLTDGEIRIGWTTKGAKFSDEYALGNDMHSIGIDISQKCIYHNTKLYTDRPIPINTELPERKKRDAIEADVIGCLIDIDKQKFVFYFNGCEINCSNINFSSSPYFAAASLALNQHCYFNFGQIDFKYPPNSQFNTFHQTSEDVEKYKLMDTMELDGEFWFRPKVIDNQIALFYQTSDDISSYNENFGKFMETGELDSRNNDYDDEFICLQLIQWIIEFMKINDENVDVVASFIGKLFDKIILKITKIKLCELFYPYLQTYIQTYNQTENNFKMHRKICILLFYMIKYNKDEIRIILSIKDQIFKYLLNIFTETPDKWTELFILICLENFEMNDYQQNKLRNNDKFSNLCQQNQKKKIYDMLNCKKLSPIDYQILFASFYVYKSFNNEIENWDTESLNVDDRTENLKLSSDRLSARSEFSWQSVRSFCSVTSDIFFFEVVLLTSGPMQIGWSARTQLQKTLVGKDEFSIAFDGYNRCIYHDSIIHELPTISKWKTGDVIGCLIDKNSQKFDIFFNGTKLELPSDIYFSTLPYYASVSLSAHQQVYFNFGQAIFCYPPKRVDYIDFCYLKKKMIADSLKNSPVIFNFKNSNLDGVYIDANGKKDQHHYQSSTSIKNSLNFHQTQTNESPIGEILKKCFLCKKQIETQLLRFACCDTLKFCLECAAILNNCPKHKSQKAPSENNQSKAIEMDDKQENN